MAGDGELVRGVREVHSEERARFLGALYSFTSRNVGSDGVDYLAKGLFSRLCVWDASFTLLQVVADSML